jgi:hypothetical protein
MSCIEQKPNVDVPKRRGITVLVPVSCPSGGCVAHPDLEIWLFAERERVIPIVKASCMEVTQAHPQF